MKTKKIEKKRKASRKSSKKSYRKQRERNKEKIKIWNKASSKRKRARRKLDPEYNEKIKKENRINFENWMNKGNNRIIHNYKKKIAARKRTAIYI